MTMIKFRNKAGILSVDTQGPFISETLIKSNILPLSNKDCGVMGTVVKSYSTVLKVYGDSLEECELKTIELLERLRYEESQ